MSEQPNEPSGSHRIPASVIVQQAEEGFKVPRNILVILIAALIGGSGTGVVTSAIHGGDRGAEIVPALQSLQQQIATLQTQLVELNKVVLEMKGDLRNETAQHQHTDETLSDHEQRIRALERARGSP